MGMKIVLLRNLLKQKSKQNAKQTSKQNRNRVANVADIILSYTLIGYKFAVSLFCFSFASTFA